MRRRRYRSMLFVPGQRDGWAAKGLAAGADAIILDLEDAVPDAEKAGARDRVAAQLDAYAADPPPDADVWVRPNSLDSRLAGLDIEQIVRPGLDGLVLPKLHTRDDVLRYDTLVAAAEIRNGVPESSVKLIASLETPEGMGACEAIAAASPRMVSLIGATARDADTARSLGFRFSELGLETLYLRSRILLASRAAGHPFAVCGIWQDIRDLEGLRRFAEHQRDLGYDGQTLIHPSHVEIVHEVFTPDADTVAFYQGMIDAFERGEAQGHGSVDYDGQHIDRAHYETAKAIVADAQD